MVSTIPRAVRGLTKDDAPSLAVAPSGRTRHAAASTTRYCVYIAPPAIPTVLPRSACAAGRRPRGHHGARAFVAHRERFVDSRRKPSERSRSQRCGDDGALRRARDRRIRHVRAGDEESQVRRVDRRGFDAHQHLVVGRGRERGHRAARARACPARSPTNEAPSAVSGRSAVMDGASFPWVGVVKGCLPPHCRNPRNPTRAAVAIFPTPTWRRDSPAQWWTRPLGRGRTSA